MNLKILGITLLIISFTFLTSVAAMSRDDQGDTEDGIQLTWDDPIASIFEASCNSCHGVAALGGLNLSTYEAAMESGSIIPGDPDGSQLIRTIEAGGHPATFTDEELAVVREWIAIGAPAGVEEVVPIEQEDEELPDVVEEDIPVVDDELVSAVTYLDNLSGSEGSFGVALNVDGSDEDTPFYERYRDSFTGEQFFIDEAHYRAVMGSAYVNFRMEDSWDTGWSGAFDFRDPNDYSFWASGFDANYFEIPSTNRSNRTDFKLGFAINDQESNAYTFNYSQRENSSRLPGASSSYTGWESNDFDIEGRFNILNLDATVGFQHRAFDDRGGELNDVNHTTGFLRAGKNLNDSIYIEGNMAYNVSEVALGDDMKTVRIGGYAHFQDILGQDHFNATARVNWENRDEGPSIFHPAGDRFSAKVGGKWRLQPELRLTGSWDMSKAKVSHADQYTMFNFRNDPDPTSVNNTYFLDEHNYIFTDTVTTNRWKIGGLWKAADALDFSADMCWINRDGLPGTDVVYALSPSLRWDSESSHVYTIRYNPGPGVGIDSGTWLVKYKTEDRTNDDRDSNSDVEHLTINWSGMVNDNIMIYLGGGALKTANTYPGDPSISQNGNEYGGGLNWQWDNRINIYFDYWNYDVGGDWGYEQTSLLAGIKYEINNDWSSSLEYDSIEGDFAARENLDFDLTNVFLKFSYRWKGY